MNRNNEKLQSYAEEITQRLLKLQEGEDLYINTEDEFLYFALIVKDKALKATHRPVTIVITEGGKPSDITPYEPEGGTASICKSKAMLHLQSLRREESPVDFDKTAKDMGAMMRYSHLADPVYLDRRIALPWCSVPCFGQDDDKGWDSLLGGPERMHENNLRRCDALNNYSIRSLRLTGKNTDLALMLDPFSRFAARHTRLSENRDFFNSLNTDEFTANLAGSACRGKAEIAASIMGTDMKAIVHVENGRLLTDPMDSGQRLLKRFFMLEKKLDRLSAIALKGSEAELILGPSSLESLMMTPSSESELPESFQTTVFMLRLSVMFDRMTATTSKGEELLLASGSETLF